jgi:hypothetical protein
MMLLFGTGSAQAYVYFSDSLHQVWRASLDGSNADPKFSHVPASSALAVDRQYLYSCDPFGNVLRVGIDGSGGALLVGGTDTPEAVAVDAGHVYWTNGGANFHNGAPGGVPPSVGRANLDGTGAVQTFIGTGAVPRALAVDGSYIYWSNVETGAIERANLDGSNVVPSFIAGASADSIAVDAAHLYWSNGPAGRIGRANIDGSAPNPAFIASASGPVGIAVDAGHVYWANRGTNSIGRADLSGAHLDPRFIARSNLYGPSGLAVDALGGGSQKSGFSFAGKALIRNGSTILRVRVPGPGVVSARQAGATRRQPALIKAVRVRAAKTGIVKLTLKPTKAGLAVLARKRKFSVTSRVTYTPTGGAPKSVSKRVILKRVKYIR